MNDNRTAIKEVQPGGPVSTVLRVIEKSSKRTRSDKPYLALTLADNTGKIQGRVWNRADHYAELFSEGDFVYLEAFAETFNNSVQLKIEHLERIAPEGVELSAFEHASVYDPSQMAADLTNLVENEVGNVLVKRVLLAILEDEEVAAKLRRAPAAKLNHHAYVAGLLEHTLSMCRLALTVADHYADYYPGMVDRDLLIAGTVLHDIGKLWELGLDKGIDYTEVGRLVGHVVMGAELVTRTFQQLGIDNPLLEMRIKHLVLSHHGELEFGAPVKPLTAEAQLLNYIDQIDAKMNMFAAAIGEQTEGFTPFNRPLGRFVYAGSVDDQNGATEAAIEESSAASEPAAVRAKAVELSAAVPSTAVLPAEPPEAERSASPDASISVETTVEDAGSDSTPTATDSESDEPPFSVYESGADRATHDLEDDDQDFDIPPWALAKAVDPPVAETEAVTTAPVEADASADNDPSSEAQPPLVETAASWRPAAVLPDPVAAEAAQPEPGLMPAVELTATEPTPETLTPAIAPKTAPALASRPNIDDEGYVDTLTLDLFDDSRR